MSSATAHASWKAWLDANWTTTPLAYENVDADLPDATSAWIYVEVNSNIYGMRSIGAPGNNRWAETGATLLHIMVPKGSGSATARGYAETLAGALREQTLADDVKVYDMSIGDGGADDDGAWWRLTLRVEWERG